MAVSTIAHSFKTKAHKLQTEPRPHNLTGLYKAVTRQTHFQSAAMMKGLQKEVEAREVFRAAMTADSHDIKICKAGLIIWQPLPFNGVLSRRTSFVPVRVLPSEADTAGNKVFSEGGKLVRQRKP
ncbi:hypothetical protein HPB48_021805 [Haemaphysalis longicornis]|uniref:Uncharacterized protein n=1 Tax=Haemaphysalis longicornis TaxID=44386 RepID=A0A9J6GLV1_HAELO|nr:hypothetical protein HPB48_021805 [Haemaphysalis longicornis]